MEADVLWKAAMKPRLPTELGKRFAFPTSPTAPAAGETGEENRKRPQPTFAELDVHNYTIFGPCRINDLQAALSEGDSRRSACHH